MTYARTYVIIVEFFFLLSLLFYAVKASDIRFYVIYTITRCRLWSAVNTLSEATGFKPRNVVRFLSSESGMVSSNLAIHSSANELLTTFTPVKSRTTSSSCSNSGINCSRTRFPNGRVPRFSPYSLKLNITIILPIRCHLRTLRCIVPRY